MLLALDTSTKLIGIAVYDGVRVLSESVRTSPFHHTIELAPAVASALEDAGVKPHGLAAVGIAIGPGSFTAIRTGLAFAKGLVMPRDLPLLGIPSLDVTAAGEPESDLPLLAVLEAGRKRLAAARYTWTGDGWRAETETELVTIEELSAGLAGPVLVRGELDRQARERLAGSEHIRLPEPGTPARRPGILAELAWQRFHAGERDEPERLSPIYLSTAGIDA